MLTDDEIENIINRLMYENKIIKSKLENEDLMLSHAAVCILALYNDYQNEQQEREGIRKKLEETKKLIDYYIMTLLKEINREQNENK